MALKTKVVFALLAATVSACGMTGNPGKKMADSASLYASEKSEERGDLYRKGVSYHHGIGVAKDHKIAKAFYEKSIKNNNDTRSMNELAVLLLDDDTNIQSISRATDLWVKAASKGNSSSRYNLGVSYFYGYANVDKDEGRGLDFISTAANQGNLRAQAFLINWLAYDSRVNIQENPVLRKRVQAWSDKGMIEYWDIAALGSDFNDLWERFFETNLKDRGPMMSDILAVESGCAECSSGDKYKVARKLTEIQKWRVGAAAGNRVDQFNLGVAYLSGDGVPLNQEEAARLMVTSAEDGYVPAQYVLGKLYLEGRGIKENKTMAYAWFNVAAADTWGYRETAWSKEMRDWISDYLPPRHVSAGQRWSTRWLAEQIGD